MGKFVFSWSNTHPLFYMLGNIDSYRRYADVPFNRAECSFQVSHGNKMVSYVGAHDLARYAEEGALFLDRAAAKRYLNDAYTQCATHHAFYAKLGAIDYSKVTNKELLSYWRGLIDNLMHSLSYFRSTQDDPSRKIVEAVMKMTDEESAHALLLSPDLDVINTEEIAWEAFMMRGFTRSGAMNHLKKFPWLFQNALSYEETINELVQRARGHVSRDIKEEKEQLVIQQKKIFARHSEIAEYATTLHELAVLRPAVKACWAATEFYALPLFIEIARRTAVDLKTLVFMYRSEDIDTLIEYGKVLTSEEIFERGQCTAYLWERGMMRANVGSVAAQLEVKVLKSRIPDAGKLKELKGSPARPGTAIGKVHILTANDPAAAKKFRESFTGGILVTSMTQPNVVDIIRKASAIVTDEGGMLSHAAIISREFGIPCVVGTHRATSVLKEGDTVEVDANKGIVTILERYG